MSLNQVLEELPVENGICVGTCGFKSPPQNDRTDIAYFTFAGHESRGVATRMASELVRREDDVGRELVRSS